MRLHLPDLFPSPNSPAGKDTPSLQSQASHGAFQKVEASAGAGPRMGGWATARLSSRWLWGPRMTGSDGTLPSPWPSQPWQETYMRTWVFFRVRFRSSRASSVSRVFWTSERFCSSSFVKTSRSCWGSVKYSSSSCNQSRVCRLAGQRRATGFCSPPERGH